MSLFPIFLKLAGVRVLVVGASSMAAARIESLLEAEAAVTVIAPQATSRVVDLAQRDQLQLCTRPFDPCDLDEVAIVFAATGLKEVDRAVAGLCRERGILCNAVDDPAYCDFYIPAVVSRGDLQIAISTNGQSPALAQQLRKELETKFDAGWALRLKHLGEARRRLIASMPAGEERNKLLHLMASAALERATRRAASR